MVGHSVPATVARANRRARSREQPSEELGELIGSEFTLGFAARRVPERRREATSPDAEAATANLRVAPVSCMRIPAERSSGAIDRSIASLDGFRAYRFRIISAIWTYDDVFGRRPHRQWKANRKPRHHVLDLQTADVSSPRRPSHADHHPGACARSPTRVAPSPSREPALAQRG